MLVPLVLLVKRLLDQRALREERGPGGAGLAHGRELRRVVHDLRKQRSGRAGDQAPAQLLISLAGICFLSFFLPAPCAMSVFRGENVITGCSTNFKVHMEAAIL